MIAQRYIDAYQEVRTLLNTELPDITPRVTETMDKIIDFIDKLVKTGHAYEAMGMYISRLNLYQHMVRFLISTWTN